MRKWIFPLLACLWLGCTDDDPNAQRLLNPPDENLNAVESFGVEYIYSDSAQINMQLRAGHLVEEDLVDQDGGRLGKSVHYFDQGVEIFLYDEAKEPHTTVRSDSAILNQHTGLLRLAGDVKMVNQRNETMQTQELIWNRSIDSIYTTRRVRIVTPDKIIVGREGLRANATFTGYEIFGIEGEIDAPDAGGE